MNQSDVDNVTRLVRSMTPPYLDAEGIALDILIETWENKLERPSRAFIHNRCVDAMRKSGREREVLLQVKPRKDYRDEDVNERSENPRDVEKKLEVERLVMVLSPMERKIVWYRFYKGLLPREIAEVLGKGINQVRETIALALEKMRNAHD